MSIIQWYPGHIAKLERQLKELLQKVDVVVEVLDARIPQSSWNPRLQKRLSEKPTVIVLNKTDLADPVQTKQWLHWFSQQGYLVLLYDCKTGQGKKKLIDAICQLGEPKMKAIEAKGLKRRPIRTLVAGMPNVGKSSIINSIVNQKKTQTGHRAGVTRQPQWVRIHAAVELLDTPGLIPPSLESEDVGALLAVVNSVGEASFSDEEVARFLLSKLDVLYPGLLSQYYQLPNTESPSLLEIATTRHYLREGGMPDLLRAAQSLLADFRHGRLGRVSLDHVS